MQKWGKNMDWMAANVDVELTYIGYLILLESIIVADVIIGCNSVSPVTM
jgi:hypothetical protein